MALATITARGLRLSARRATSIVPLASRASSPLFARRLPQNLITGASATMLIQRQRGHQGAPTIENVLAAERIDGLIGRLVEASCREGTANEPARCSSAVDVAVVIIAQLMEAAETNAEALQRIESSQQPRRPDRLDLTKFDFELATNKGSTRYPDWQFQSAAKWTLKKIHKDGDGAILRFTKDGRDSPPIRVSDINDAALSAAQLDRRVRFAGGARAGPKLVTIIKAHPTFA